MPQSTPLLTLAALCCAGLLGGCDRLVTPPPPATAPQAAAAASAAPAPVATPAASIVAAPVAATPPAEVTAYREERDKCDHFRGEDPTDAKRRAELRRQMDKFCKGTDARLAELRRKFAGQPAVLATLKDYEDSIE